MRRKQRRTQQAAFRRFLRQTKTNADAMSNRYTKRVLAMGNAVKSAVMEALSGAPTDKKKQKELGHLGCG